MTPLVLAIETSTEIASVAVLRGADVIAEEESPNSSRNDQLLLPRIHDALNAAHVELSDVKLLAVALGPGSFGGLRVGLATIKGLAIAGAIPTIGVCSLSTLAAAAPDHARWVLAVIDAHRGELYAALYERQDGALIERVAPFCSTPDDVAAQARAVCGELVAHILGDGLREHAATLARAWPALAIDPATPLLLPRARHVGLLALSQLATQGADDLASLLPNYVRASDAKLPPRPLELSPDQQ